MLKLIVDDLKLSSSDTRIAVAVYSTTTNLAVPWQQNKTEAQLAIDKMNIVGGGTFLADALKFAREEIFCSSRADAFKYLFLLTDGVTGTNTETGTDLQTEVTAILSKNVVLLTVGQQTDTSTTTNDNYKLDIIQPDSTLRINAPTYAELPERAREFQQLICEHSPLPESLTFEACACANGFHHSDVDGKTCVANQCICTNGFGTTGVYCEEHDTEDCARCTTESNFLIQIGVVDGRNTGNCNTVCTDDYRVDESSGTTVCVEKTCACENGTGLLSSSCEADGVDNVGCRACDAGFHLVGVSCVQNV